MNYQSSQALQDINLSRPPVAIAFLATPPVGLSRIDRAAAAGCAYWKHASDGNAFYTMPEDHYNCPVGAFTHGAELPPAQATELQGLIGTMIELQYLRQDEIPRTPHRSEPLRVTAYAPLMDARFAPDVVIFRGNARQIMLLTEAARAAGAVDDRTVMGRPACAAIPQALASAATVASIGCIGSRVHTGLKDDELFLAMPGGIVEQALAQLQTVTSANAELEKFHRARAASFGA